MENEIKLMMMEDKEIWKNIDEEGYYQVSQFGNVRSFVKMGTAKGKRSFPRLMKITLTKSGYGHLGLAGKFKFVHRLVAQAFIPNLMNYKQVDHIDQNKVNNCVNNLRWCSPSQNILNIKIHPKNKTGYKGVFFSSDREKYHAHHSRSGKSFSRRFDTLEEAVKFRKDMVDKYYNKEFYVEK